MAFKGKVFATVDRFGRETVEQVRPATRQDRLVLGRVAIRRFNGNAVRERKSDQRHDVMQLCDVSPEFLK